MQMWSHPVLTSWRPTAGEPLIEDHYKSMWMMWYRMAQIYTYYTATERSSQRAEEERSREQQSYTSCVIICCSSILFPCLLVCCDRLVILYRAVSSPDLQKKACLTKTIWHLIIIQSNPQIPRTEAACHVKWNDTKLQDKNNASSYFSRGKHNIHFFS